MTQKPITEYDSNELVSFTNTGNPIQPAHAQAELTRRLIKSIHELDDSTTRYSSVLVALTLMLLVLGFLQLVLSIFTTPFPVVARFVVGGVFTVLLLFVGRNVVKTFLE